MSTLEEFRQDVEDLLRTLESRSYIPPDTELPTDVPDQQEFKRMLLLICLNSHLGVGGLLQKTPIELPQLRQLADDIRQLPMVRAVVDGIERIKDPGELVVRRDLSVLKFKLREMLEYLDMSLPSEPNAVQEPDDWASSIPTRAPSKGRRQRPKRRKNLTPSERRADTVAKIIQELNILKPGMTGSDLDYDGLRRDHPGFLTFKIAGQHPDLKNLVLGLQNHKRYIRLAQQLAARKCARELSTVQTDWKRHKPHKYRQRNK